MIDLILEALLAEPEVRAHLPRIAALEPSRSVLIGNRWQQRTGWALFTSGDPAPVLVVKADHFEPYKPRLQAEHEVLTALNRRPELVGSVPEPVALMTVGNALVFAQTGLAGTPLSVLTRQRLWPSPRASARDHRLVMDWLVRLHGDVQAAARRDLDAAAVVAVVERLLPDESRDGRFVRDLRAMARSWPHVALPLLPGHGDLGTSNCVIDRGMLRVFDWEGGGDGRTPLADLVVFLNHYVRPQPLRNHQLRRKTDAFSSAFLDDGWLAALTRRSYLDQLARLDLPTEAAEYLLIATLADLANGTAPISHAARARDYWTLQLRRLAAAGPVTAFRTRAPGRQSRRRARQ